MVYNTATICKLVGVTKNTLFDWERKGFIHPQRDEKDWRIYSEMDLEEIRKLAETKRQTKY